MSSPASLAAVSGHARRAYEAARLRRGLVRGAAFGALLGIVSSVALGLGALAWLPVFIGVWTLLEWRGDGFLRGGRVGALFGALLAIVPSGLFMTSCRIGCTLASGVCCSTSRACAGIGGLVGLGVAALLARLPAGKRVQTTFGATAGLIATSIPRCSGLMLGEAFGLVVGLLVGTVAAGLACAVVDRIRHPAGSSLC